MEDKLDIFILGYKAFEPKVSHPVYTIVDGGEEEFTTSLPKLNDSEGDSISHLNGFYSELTRIYWIWKNHPIKEYIGFCHYRRYFSFFDDIPNMDDIFKNHDIILPSPYGCSNVMRQYRNSHNLNDYKIALAIIKKHFPDYYETALKFSISSKEFYINNCFIMKREMFFKYCEFIFPILESYLNYINAKKMEDVEKHVMDNKDDYLKKSYPNNQIWYQCRIGGFLAERLFSIWLLLNVPKERIFYVPIKVTEKKY